MKRLSDRSINDFDEDDFEKEFWTDGKDVFYRYTKLKGAHPAHFVYENYFGKDQKRCFCGEICLKNADAETFHPLNFTFAMDRNNIYTLSGKMTGVDVETFKVLDEGKSLVTIRLDGVEMFATFGYAKDKNNVYFYDGEKRIKLVKNADIETFISMNDGYFGRDKNNIYGFGKVLKNADVASWQKLTTMRNSYYSKDKKQIFYGFWQIKHADYDTFEVVIPEKAKFIREQLAKDINNYYHNGEVISEENFKKFLEN